MGLCSLFDPWDVTLPLFTCARVIWMQVAGRYFSVKHHIIVLGHPVVFVASVVTHIMEGIFRLSHWIMSAAYYLFNYVQ